MTSCIRGDTCVKTRAYKIAGVVLVLVAVLLSSLALVLSYNASCEPPPSLASGTQPMKAIVSRCYGSPDVLELADIAKPTVADNEVLVRVHAASVNPLDWHYMRGSPYIMRMDSGVGRPKDVRVGVDFAGTVEAVGEKVTRFRAGDEVFGGRSGAFAEYVTVADDRAIVLKPPGITFEQAAAVPIAGVTALQALRDKGQIKARQKVLINGASGGVGTFAVQIAKAFGAEVTGVCSTRNLEMVRSLGADHVIDYTKEDFIESGERYDLIIDNVGNRSLLAYRHVLNPDGIFVIVGGTKGDWVGPFANAIKALLFAPFLDQEFALFLASLNQEDLGILGDLMKAGNVTPVIDRRYPLNEAAAAMRYSEEGHARGKIIIAVAQDRAAN